MDAEDEAGGMRPSAIRMLRPAAVAAGEAVDRGAGARRRRPRAQRGRRAIEPRRS